VVLALALLVVGAIALFGAVTNDSGAPGVTVSGTPSSTNQPQQSASATSNESSAKHALVLRPVTVLVATPGNTKTFISGTLYKGDIRTLDESEMVVTVDPAQNVQVLIKGKDVSKGANGHQVYQING